MISDADAALVEKTQLLERNIASFRSAYPEYAFRLFELADLRKFLQSEFGDDVVALFDRIKPFAFKADLARYCLMFHFGGIYADISHYHLAPIQLPEGKQMVVFRDRPEHPPWAVCNGLIAARPQCGVFERAIKMVADNTEQGFYGQWSLEPTGPYLFGRALAQMSDWRIVDFGTSRVRRNLFSSMRGRAHDRTEKVTADETVVAYKEKRVNSEIREFIGVGGNNYHHIWLRRQIWGERDIFISLDDPIVSVSSVAKGHNAVELDIRHPELRLDAGSYELHLGVGGGDAEFGEVWLRNDKGETISTSRLPDGPPSFAIKLKKPEIVQRICVSGASDSLNGVEYVKFIGPGT